MGNVNTQQCQTVRIMLWTTVLFDHQYINKMHWFLFFYVGVILWGIFCETAVIQYSWIDPGTKQVLANFQVFVIRLDPFK